MKTLKTFTFYQGRDKRDRVARTDLGKTVLVGRQHAMPEIGVEYECEIEREESRFIVVRPVRKVDASTRLRRRQADILRLATEPRRTGSHTDEDGWTVEYAWRSNEKTHECVVRVSHPECPMEERVVLRFPAVYAGQSVMGIVMGDRCSRTVRTPSGECFDFSDFRSSERVVGRDGPLRVVERDLLTWAGTRTVSRRGNSYTEITGWKVLREDLPEGHTPVKAYGLLPKIEPYLVRYEVSSGGAERTKWWWAPVGNGDDATEGIEVQLRRVKGGFDASPDVSQMEPVVQKRGALTTLHTSPEIGFFRRWGQEIRGIIDPDAADGWYRWSHQRKRWEPLREIEVLATKHQCGTVSFPVRRVVKVLVDESGNFAVARSGNGVGLGYATIVTALDVRDPLPGDREVTIVSHDRGDRTESADTTESLVATLRWFHVDVRAMPDDLDIIREGVERTVQDRPDEFSFGSKTTFADGAVLLHHEELVFGGDEERMSGTERWSVRRPSETRYIDTQGVVYAKRGPKAR